MFYPNINKKPMKQLNVCMGFTTSDKLAAHNVWHVIGYDLPILEFLSLRNSQKLQK